MDCGARHGNPQAKELQILPPLGGLNKLLLYNVPTSTQTQRSGIVRGLFLHIHYKHVKDGTSFYWLSSKSPQNSEDVGVVGMGALKESSGGGGVAGVVQLLRPQQTQKRETEYSQKEAARFPQPVKLILTLLGENSLFSSRELWCNGQKKCMHSAVRMPA